jgi:hypothetical protein
LSSSRDFINIILCIRLEGCTFSLPYIKWVSEKLARILNEGDIGVSFSPPYTIKDMVESLPNMHKGVYSIPFSYGKVYIHETGRSMKIRLKEHNVDIKWNRTHKSSLA